MASHDKIIDSMAPKKTVDPNGKNGNSVNSQTQISPGIDKLAEKMVDYAEGQLLALYAHKLGGRLADPNSNLVKKLNETTENIVDDKLQNFLETSLASFLPEGTN